MWVAFWRLASEDLCLQKQSEDVALRFCGGGASQDLCFFYWFKNHCHTQRTFHLTFAVAFCFRNCYTNTNRICSNERRKLFFYSYIAGLQILFFFDLLSASLCDMLLLESNDNSAELIFAIIGVLMSFGSFFINRLPFFINKLIFACFFKSFLINYIYR